jgi:5-hydroxyisourate hydrolase
VTHARPTISTHVLDTAAGSPRPGITVRLRRESPAGGSLVAEGVTDQDGRINDLLNGGTLEPGAYRLEFDLDRDGFFTAISVDLRIEDVTRSYHVPLLLAPFGLTTYRGS